MRCNKYKRIINYYSETTAWAVIDKQFPKQILFWYDNKGTSHLDIHFQKREAIKAQNEWKKAYKPEAEVIPIKIYLQRKINRSKK